MILTLNIDTNSDKALAFVAFIKTLDFIKINDKSESRDYFLTDRQIKILEDRKERHINNESKSYSWKDIKDELRNSDR